MGSVARCRRVPRAAVGRRHRARRRRRGRRSSSCPRPSGARADAVVAKVGERTALVGGHTVVALAGATGSGKSSLFNALVGDAVAKVGVRRPTTSTPDRRHLGRRAGRPTLLDWLGVGTRHLVRGRDRTAERSVGSLDGLVLLDLPDFDSRELDHRTEAERVLELVDLFVWVTDPQKYADARLHDDYVAALSTHEAVTMVVLNQADRLTPAEVEQCRADLVRLMERDGVPAGHRARHLGRRPGPGSTSCASASRTPSPGRTTAARPPRR